MSCAPLWLLQHISLFQLSVPFGYVCSCLNTYQLIPRSLWQAIVVVRLYMNWLLSLKWPLNLPHWKFAHQCMARPTLPMTLLSVALPFTWIRSSTPTDTWQWDVLSYSELILKITRILFRMRPSGWGCVISFITRIIVIFLSTTNNQTVNCANVFESSKND